MIAYYLITAYILWLLMDRMADEAIKPKETEADRALRHEQKKAFDLQRSLNVSEH